MNNEGYLHFVITRLNMQTFSVLLLVLRALVVPVTSSVAVQATNSIVNIPDLYSNCDLNIFVLRTFKEIQTVPPYFHAILEQSTYTPRLINIAIYDTTNIYGLNHLVKNYGFPKNGASSSRCMAVIVDLEQLNQIPFEGESISFWILYYVITFLNPGYILAHVHDPKDGSYYEGYILHQGYSKLVLWNMVNPNEIYIPCVSSKNPTSAIDIADVTSLTDIDSRWHFANGNMQNKLLWNAGAGHVKPILNPRSRFTCGPNYIWFKKGDRRSCTISIFETKYNLTLSNARPRNEWGYRKNFVGGEFRMGIIPKGQFKGKAYSALEVYRVDYQIYEFVVVTHPPSLISSFAALFAPFDDQTWISLVLAGLLAAACLQFQGCSVVNGGNIWGMMMEDLSGGLLRVTALLLSQASDGKVFKACPRTLGISIGYAFACFILMGNLYGGEMFSNLATTELPNVPKTMVELGDSNLPVFTTSAYFSTKGGSLFVGSILKDTIIPELVAKLQGELNSTKVLDLIFKIKKKLTFAEVKRDLQKDPNSYPIPLLNHSITRNQTFAILDTRSYLSVLVGSAATSFGKRFIVPSKDVSGSHLNYVKITHGKKHYFTPEIYATLGQLTESGIYQRWVIVEELRVESKTVKKLWSNSKDHAIYFAKKMAKLKNHNIVVNEFKAVELTMTKYTLIVFLLGCVAGFILFLVEFLQKYLQLEKVHIFKT